MVTRLCYNLYLFTDKRKRKRKATDIIIYLYAQHARVSGHSYLIQMQMLWNGLLSLLRIKVLGAAWACHNYGYDVNMGFSSHILLHSHSPN